jgi:acetyltransferase-like isoleucine patch superfamily enzyme
MHFASIGEDVIINKFVEIRHPNRIKIGNHVAIDFGFFITTSASIGDYIHIGPYVSSIGGQDSYLTLGHLSSVAAGVRFICYGDEHLGEGIVGALIPREFQDKRVGGKIEVKKYAAIGTNAIVMPGVIVGEGAVLGANSLLLEAAEPWTIYVGSPARPIRKRKSEKILRYATLMGYE